MATNSINSINSVSSPLNSTGSAVSINSSSNSATSNNINSKSALIVRKVVDPLAKENRPLYFDPKSRCCGQTVNKQRCRRKGTVTVLLGDEEEDGVKELFCMTHWRKLVEVPNSSASKQANKSKCPGTTIKGNQCKRMVNLEIRPSGYCFHHEYLAKISEGGIIISEITDEKEGGDEEVANIEENEDEMMNPGNTELIEETIEDHHSHSSHSSHSHHDKHHHHHHHHKEKSLKKKTRKRLIEAENEHNARDKERDTPLVLMS